MDFRRVGFVAMQSIDLCGTWRFQVDPAGSGAFRGYFWADYNSHRWREVQVPSSFEMCMPILEGYEASGWFRRAFFVPAEWVGHRIVLRFSAVNYHASVWVNGEHVGDHNDGFLPFEFAVQNVVRFGEENVVVVRADNERRKGEAPGMQRGWRPMGGILREVALVATAKVYVEHVTIVAEPPLSEGAGALSMKATVNNAGDRPASVSLAAQCTDEDGVRHAFTAVGQNCAAGESVYMEIGGTVATVLPWSPDRPRLYEVEIALSVDGEVVDRRIERVGFRRIETRGTELYLNDDPIFLTGFNRHEDSPTTGMCPDMATTRQDLIDMKAAGCNFIRLCHYPHHPEELALCDELGLLAMSEIPLMWWDGLAEGEEMYARKLAAAVRQLKAMIRRDGNHPSVAFWSVSNETHEQRAEVVAGNRSLLALARRLDPTRLVTHASNRWREGQWAREEKRFEADMAVAGADEDVVEGADVQFEDDDVICVNAYPSLNQRGFGGRHDYDFADSMRYWREELAKLHARYPGKPIMVSEFGYASLEGVFENDFGEDAQSEAIAQEFAGMDASYVCGAAVWCWADHPWPQTGFCRNMRTSPYGVLTRERRKLAAYGTIQKLFCKKQRGG